MDKQDNPSEGVKVLDRQAEEKQWVEAIRAGRKDVFKLTFEAYYDPLLRFAFRYVKSEAVAEDLVQNIFLWIWENREEWNVEGNLKTYLFRAVKYKAMDYWRHDHIKKQYMERFSETQKSLSDQKQPFESKESDFVQAVQQAVEELPERSRMVYKLSRLEGLTYPEIAEVLEISPKTVETHVSRALDFLRKRLYRFLPVFSVIGFVNELFR